METQPLVQPIVIQSMDANSRISRSTSTEAGNSSIDGTERRETSEKPLESPKVSGWMLKSALRVFFEFPTINGKKFAQCLYCRRRYPEGESTGNLSKHIRNVHPAAFENRDKKVKKMRTLKAFVKRSNALRVSNIIKDEYEKCPESFQSVMLVVEGFLPFTWVQLNTWDIINKTRDSKFIQSRTTLVKKLDLYTAYMDECLAMNLKDTHLVNILIDIWTATNNESFLAIMVSFVPNFFNETTLKVATGPSIFFNRAGKAQNIHLLDFRSLGSNKRTGPYMHTLISSILEKHQLLDKVATITMDNARNNEAFYSYLVNDNLKIYKPLAYRLFKKVRYIRCASHILNLQFQKLFDHLNSKGLFTDAYANIVKMAKVMRYSTRISTSLKNSRTPLIPLDCPTRWMLKWHQIERFLANRGLYETWCKTMEEMGDAKLAARLQKFLLIDSRTTQLLTYFVQICDIFNTLTLQLQEDDYNCLSNAVSFYYLLDHYYKACSQASEGAVFSEPPSAANFSHLNGSSALHPEDKELVLEAMAIAQKSHSKYFTEIKSDPIYYLSVLLDPRLKTEKLYGTMHTSEANESIQLCETFIKNYFKEYELTHPSKECATVTKPTQPGNHNIFEFDRQRLGLIDSNPDGEYKTDDRMVQIEEWTNYLGEPLLSATSREAAITWWFDRRLRFPRLFKLAMSLFYTKISTCDVERCFSLAGRVMQKDRKRLVEKNVRTSMVLRDRFHKFNFYKNREGSFVPNEFEEMESGSESIGSDLEGSVFDTDSDQDVPALEPFSNEETCVAGDSEQGLKV
ncbi:putative transposase of the Rover4 hAT-like DNA transposon [Lachancea lanzarotensis]|uniref:LALA0S01e18514g1_1 n=1 Tax=Lachancea lanzarotensis TaxID=1245769 RepID=A0A0C7MYW6_9SACH|nr:putative transposase of the Rover4 hAT-like DNA transposon [Lachancea lanzarotensis]CEP60768.1 putative transposase of the Rover4 hAT-like DNA transposon [Lachancea lanzarotensis]